MESNWRKSSYSGDNGGECVEVASAEAVLVRDTTDRNGPVLTFTADAWRAFTATIGKPRRYCRFPANLSNSQVSCPLDVQLDISRGELSVFSSGSWDVSRRRAQIWRILRRQRIHGLVCLFYVRLCGRGSHLSWRLSSVPAEAARRGAQRHERAVMTY